MNQSSTLNFSTSITSIQRPVLIKKIKIVGLQEKYNVRLPKSYKNNEQETVERQERQETVESEQFSTVDDELIVDKDLLIGMYILCRFWWSLNTLYHIWNFYYFTENKKLRSANEKLEYELMELRRKYSRLENCNHEITKKADHSSREIKRLKEEMQVLLSINEEFGNENDELQKEVSRYHRSKSTSNKRSTEESQKPNKTSTEERRNTSKRKKINKKIVYREESESSASGADDEPREKEARVSKFWLTVIYFHIFYSNLL